MQKARREFIYRLTVAGMAFWAFLGALGCINLVTKPYKLYDGPILPPDKIAVLICVLPGQISIDDQPDVNPESGKWGGRLEMMPGTHRVGIRPNALWLRKEYRNLPEILPEYAVYFDAVAGKTYKVILEPEIVDKIEIERTKDATTFQVTNVEVRFHIIEMGDKKVVSRPTA
jgi:hypothetical protein